MSISISVGNVPYPVHKSHARSIQKWIDQNMDDNWKPRKPEPVSMSESPQTTPLSYTPIQQNLPDSVRSRLSTETEQSTPHEFSPHDHLLPKQCSCGNSWKSYNECYRKGVYYALTFKKNVIVNCRRCVANKCTWHYDGQEEGVFNYSGDILVSYALLKDYHNSCIKGGMTWTSYVEKISNMYNEVYCDQDKQMTFMSNPSFVKASTIISTPALIFYLGFDCFYGTQY